MTMHWGYVLAFALVVVLVMLFCTLIYVRYLLCKLNYLASQLEIVSESRTTWLNEYIRQNYKRR